MPVTCAPASLCPGGGGPWDRYVESRDAQREWHLLTGYGFVCIMLAVGDGTPRAYFRPVDESNVGGQKCYAFWLITMTSFVSWVMAKSIQNSAKLGAKYGLTGGLAYAAWFVGVFTTGVIVFLLRKQGYYSLPDFINDRWGSRGGGSEDGDTVLAACGVHVL